VSDTSQNEAPEPTDSEGPFLKLNAKEVLELINSHTKTDKDSFDRLLKWFVGAASVLFLIAGFFGYQTKQEVTATAEAIRQEARTQIQPEVSKETSQENIQKYISEAIQKKTDAQFRNAIAKAVEVELDTPARRQMFEHIVQRHVDALTNELAGEYEVSVNGVKDQRLFITKKLSSTPAGNR